MFVFLILLAGYLLVYINTPDSADGDAILAVSAALVRSGSADISVIGAQDALFEHDMSRMGVFGLDGALYSKKGVAPSLALLPLTIAAQVAPWLPVRATAMLFNPLVTALTGALLYTGVRALDVRPRTALGVALLYGFGSTAVVYTKTLFGEPLAALLILSAVLSILRFWRDGSLRPLVWAGAAIGFATGINLTYLLTAVLLAVFALAPSLRGKATATRLLQAAAAFSAPIAVTLVIIAIYNAARFGSPLTSGYYFGDGEGFNRPFLLGLFGLTFSPYRGLLWYTPLALMALPGAWLLARVQSKTTWLLLALIGAQFAVYASWWSWHGGVVWGPRFILPVLPLIMLCTAPIIERTFSQRGTAVGVSLLAALSIGVQIPGIVLSPYPFYGVLSGRYGTGDMDAVVATLRDDVLTDGSANAVIGHLELLAQSTPFDPMWLRGDGPIAVCALALAGTAGWLFRSRNARPLASVLLICFVVLNLVPASQQDDPSVESARRLESALPETAPLLVASNHYGSALLDIESHPVLSMTAPTAPDDPLAAPMWRHAQALDSRLWYVTWFPPADANNWIEGWLWEHASFAQESAVDGHRALYFDFAAAEADMEVDWRFGDIRLIRYGVAEDSGDLWVSLDWTTEHQNAGDYQFFAHVLDAQGSIIAQQDRPPLGGYYPTSAWRSGESVQDKLFFPQTPDAAALRIGWIDPLANQRLPVTTADGERLAEGFIIIPLSP